MAKVGTTARCAWCTAEFIVTAPNRLTCSRACSRRRGKRQDGERLRPCEVCLKPYRTSRWNGRVCSLECRWFISTQTIKKIDLDWRWCDACARWTTQGSRHRHRDKKKQAERPTPRRCTECSTIFTPGVGGAAAVCCSDRCRKRRGRRRHRATHGRDDQWRKRARRFGVSYEPINRSRVFARDGWRCGICGCKTIRTREVPDPRAATIDHIVPMSKGGSHTYANVQCAHFECNWRKSAGVGASGDQLRLVG